MNVREVDFLLVNIMQKALLRDYAEQFPDDDYHDVRRLLEDQLTPIFSDYGRELIKQNFEIFEARMEIAHAASADRGRI